MNASVTELIFLVGTGFYFVLLAILIWQHFFKNRKLKRENQKLREKIAMMQRELEALQAWIEELKKASFHRLHRRGEKG